MTQKILKPEFFQRDVLVVAPELLGKFLVRKLADTVIAEPITEVEAYLGTDDLASHARFGKTKRNEIMFGPGGYWYVFLNYGIHWLVNAVCGVEGQPSAVLLRGVQNISGPGRLTKHFQIDKSFHALPITAQSGLWIEDRGVKVAPQDIVKSPRIGVDYSGPIWSQKHYRFYLK